MIFMSDSGSAVTIPSTIEDQTTSTGDGLEARVTVYNCNCHTYQQVITLFCQAIPGMNPTRAFELAWRIDHEGNAIVYSGEWKTAEDIAKKLISGGLRVTVQ
jgi:ATP-dependent Clp protease adaptor protein ClpS